MGCPCHCCDKLGACCLDGACTQETCADCEASGGTWQGPNTACVDDACPCDPPAQSSQCEKCEDGAVVSRCKEGRVCRDGKCVWTGTPGATAWRIRDQEERVYAQGSISGGVLDYLPDPWVPEFYYSTTLDMTLEALCGAWATLQSWSAEVVLCGSLSERYPEEPLPGPWPPPTGCDCLVYRSDSQIIDPCIPVPELIAGSGTGQEWRDPQPGVAVTFTGAIDGEWSNLLNWEDADGETPASSLPTGNVIIQGAVTSAAVAAGAVDMTIQASGSLHVAATVDNLYCFGTVGRSSICDGVYGSVAVTGDCEFDGGTLDGEETASGAPARFLNGGQVTADGGLYGNAIFTTGSENYGIVHGNGTFDGLPGTDNWGVVTGNGTFLAASTNYSTVEGDGIFGNSGGDDEANNVGAVEGNAIFRGHSFNVGTVDGNAEFEDDATNGDAFGSPGAVGGNAEFSDRAKSLEGAVAGTATFTDSACYVSGTAGTFVPAEPPECV